MEKSSKKPTNHVNKIAFAILFLQAATASAQGISQKVTSFQQWLWPILNGIVTIALIIAFVVLVVALATGAHDVKKKAVYFLIALVVWAAKAIIFSDIAGIFI